MTLWRRVKVLSLPILILLVLTGSSFGEEPDTVDIYEKVVSTAVDVILDGHHAGSGNFVSPDGMVLSAYHIFQHSSNDSEIEIVSSRFGRMRAELIALDSVHDLSLLKVNPHAKGEYPFLDVAEDNPPVGTEIYSVSTPIYIHSLFNRAMIASEGIRFRKVSFCKAYTEMIYVHGLTPRGSSGTCWVNAEGEIVGVQSGWINSMGHTSQPSGVSFIGPASAISEIIKKREAGRVLWIGGTLEELWTQPMGFIKRFPNGVEGLVVHKIDSHGPLEATGVQREWLITHVNGEKVRFKKDFLALVRQGAPGQQLNLSLLILDSGNSTEKTLELEYFQQRR